MRNKNKVLTSILVILAASVLLSSGLIVYLALTRERQDTDLAVPEASRTLLPQIREQETVVTAASEPRIAFTSAHENETAVYVAVASDWHPQRVSRTDHIACLAPSWSPNGRRVAYLVEQSHARHSVWVAAADGTEHIRVNGTISGTLWGPPTWSPDGALLAFTSGNQLTKEDGSKSVVYVVRTDGTGIERSIPLPWHVYHLLWSPAGDDMLFVGRATSPWEESSSADEDTDDVYVMSCAGEDIIQIAAKSRAADWSPDGENVAVASYETGEILITDRSQTSQHVAWLGGQYPEDIVWSPDGTRIAVATALDHPHGFPTALHIIVLKTGKIVPVVESGDWLNRLNWSADGRNLLLTRTVVSQRPEESYSSASDLWVYHAESDQLEQLTQTAEREGMAVWSP